MIKILDQHKFEKHGDAYIWDSSIHKNSENTAYEKLLSIISSIKEACKKVFSVKMRYDDCHWLTLSVITPIEENDALRARCRDALKNYEMRSQFRVVRNSVTSVTLLAKNAILFWRVYGITPKHGENRVCGKQPTRK